MKLTDYGAASPHNEILSKEDERSAELARRAQKGDYDDGSFSFNFTPTTLTNSDRTSQTSFSNNLPETASF